MNGTDIDGWILQQRGPRTEGLHTHVPYGFFVEQECGASGEVGPVATVLLTNRECPWRCVMCDLWKNTLTESVPSGAIPAQIDYALARLPAARRIKLYNSGSFFDGRAIPVGDWAAIAARLDSFETAVVECHPALIGERVLRFRDLLLGGLEVAIGLETAHPEVLARLNKRMTLAQFAKAAKFLRQHGIAVRAFVLVQPPFMAQEEALFWAQQSLEFAFDSGASAVSLILTRGGNGTLEAIGFRPPSLRLLEQSIEYGLRLGHGRVFADVWDVKLTALDCQRCFEARVARLASMNLRQVSAPSIVCDECGGG